MLAHEVAANIIDTVSERKSTVKSLVLNSKFKNIKQLYALVCETLKYRVALERILDSSQLLKRERKLAAKSRTFCIVLLYDFLFGKGLHAAGHWKACILNHKTALNAELARIKIKSGAIKNEDLIPQEIQAASLALPRYVRVNTLKTNLDKVLQQFKAGRFVEVENPGDDLKSFTETVRNLKPKQFVKDFHLENLLVFAAKTDLHDHPLYRSGHIILQDKASCFPSYILSPPPGSSVIDCCAAPGNKTSHMAAIMKNKGEIYAFDLDPKRLKLMKKLCHAAGATNINYLHQDFLKVDPEDSRYSNVEYILVDPSCSGSGIASRLNSLTDDEDSSSKDRLKSLAKFQKSIVKHAMAFPKVKVITYSTCSIHQEENEDVVRDVLEHCGGKFQLVHSLKDWAHRGEGADNVAEFCIRASQQEDLTNGFFVACFKRTSSVEKVLEVCDSTSVSVHKKDRKRQKRAKKRKLIDVSQTASVPNKSCRMGAADFEKITCGEELKSAKLCLGNCTSAEESSVSLEKKTGQKARRQRAKLRKRLKNKQADSVSS